MVFKFTPEEGGKPLKLKVEVNTREHQNLHGLKTYPFEVVSDWHKASTWIVSFEPEDIFGTKLRALLQRNKNRDLFDLNEGLLQLGLDCDRVIGICRQDENEHSQHEGQDDQDMAMWFRTIHEVSAYARDHRAATNKPWLNDARPSDGAARLWRRTVTP